MAKDPAAQRGAFIGLRKDQLGARLLMMLNAIRLAQDYNAGFRINWFPRGAMAPKLANPEDLFSAEFIEKHFIPNDTFEALKPDPLPLWTFRKDRSPDRLEAHLAKGGNVVLDEGFEVIRFPWEDAEDLSARFRSFITLIGFNPTVARHIETIEARLNAAEGRTIAYHIRRGDILNEDPWKHKEWPAKIEPDELYSAYLDKNDNAGALVFSDQPESIKRFTEAHPQVANIDSLVDLSDCKPVQRDFLELFAMSRASEIIAPPISAFSRAAARLSGQESKIFRNVLSSDEIDAAYDRAAARLLDGPQNFITPSEAAHVYARVSRWLQDKDRFEDSYAIARSLLDAGADNAFLPLFHALDCIYLSRWKEALGHIDTALASPNLWKEQYVIALAIRAHILGALGRPVKARRSFLRALWQKPNLPDVRVVGTFMIKRGRLKPGAALPFDLEAVSAITVPYHTTNIVLHQYKILVRRALDLSMIVVEWPWFGTDGKVDRLLKTPASLEQLQERLAEHHKGRPGAGPFSFSALLDARMGRLDRAFAWNSKAVEVAPQDPMVRKRQAEIHMLRGDYKAALMEMQAYRACAPEHAFWHFLTGKILEAAGNRQAALGCFVAACKLDDSTAELHAITADRLLEAGQTDSALEALQRAADIAPNQPRYQNRRDRILKKSA